MNWRQMLLITFMALVAEVTLQAQSVLKPGDSVTWQFQLQYDSTLRINHPEQTFGGHVMLDYSCIPQAGSLDYRLDFYEDFTSFEPILSFPVHHLTGLHDQFGMPLFWVPEFSPPSDAWRDMDGMLQMTILSGEMRAVTPYISMLVPATPGFMDYYQAMVVPEPGILGLFGLGWFIVRFLFRRFSLNGLI